MDYGKKNLKKNKEKLSDKKARTKKKLAFTVVKSVLIVFLLGFAVVFAAGGIYVGHLISECPDIKDVDVSPVGFATTVYDSDGNEIETLAASGANREYVTIDEIPEDLQHAFVAIEDSRFYTHNGIDAKGIIRAAFIGIFNGGDFSQGASTITQQLLKNNYFTNWTNEGSMDRINRKIQEQYLAVQLETVMSKEQILENYLNTINLGQNTLGVEAASQRYFNKHVSDLTLSESAVIAGITQNPSKYNPITNPDDNATRRSKVLRNMLDQGYIRQDEYETAVADEVYDRIQVANNEVASDSTSYFVDAVTEQLEKDLIEEKGYSETQAYQAVYSGGLKVYSTQNTTMQNIVMEEINNEDNYSGSPEWSFTYRLTITKSNGTYENYSEQTMLSFYQAQDPSYSINFPTQEDAAAAIEQYKADIMEEGDTIGESGESVIYTMQPQVAMTVMDHSTGSVLALVGGRGDKAGSRTLNRATSITRQTGSTFKILATYAPAIDAAGMTLATVQDDAPMSYANGSSLKNYDNSYRGYTNIRTAITYSINVVAVKTLTEIGTGLGLEYAQDLGITTLVSADNTQALALGGVTNGVTNIDLCNSFATIANKGNYHKPILYTKVEDRDGNILIDNTDNEEKEVLKDTTAWLLIDAMKDVITSGTGGKANIANMEVAGKTGTTNSDRDSAFAGMTPYYTAAIWGGYDDNSPQSTTAYPMVIWSAAMSRIHEGLEYADFEKPSGITTASVCKKSGKLAISGVCDSDPRGNMVYTEYFAKGTVPTSTCDHHTSVTICNDSGLPAGEYCPEESKANVVYMTSGGGDDAAYLVPPMDIICDVHNEETKRMETDDEKREEEQQDDTSSSSSSSSSSSDSASSSESSSDSPEESSSAVDEPEESATEIPE